MLPKIVNQSDITVDVSLNVLERCPGTSDVIAEKGGLHVEANEQGGDEEGVGETEGVDEETQIPSLSSWHTVLSWQFPQMGTV